MKIDKKEYDKLYYTRNKERILMQHKEYQKLHLDKFRAANRRHRGVKNPTGETRFGMCPICKEECQLTFDHNHRTGALRGWICKSCNRGIGYFGDSPERLRLAASYVEVHDAH